MTERGDSNEYFNSENLIDQGGILSQAVKSITLKFNIPFYADYLGGAWMEVTLLTSKVFSVPLVTTQVTGNTLILKRGNKILKKIHLDTNYVQGPTSF